MRFAPTTTAASHSPEERARQASCSAVREEEQAVRTVRLWLLASRMSNQKEWHPEGSPWSHKAKFAADAICRHIVAISGELIHVVALGVSPIDLLPVSLKRPHIDSNIAAV